MLVRIKHRSQISICAGLKIYLKSLSSPVVVTQCKDNLNCGIKHWSSNLKGHTLDIKIKLLRITNLNWKYFFKKRIHTACPWKIHHIFLTISFLRFSYQILKKSKAYFLGLLLWFLLSMCDSMDNKSNLNEGKNCEQTSLSI